MDVSSVRGQSMSGTAARRTTRKSARKEKAPRSRSATVDSSSSSSDDLDDLLKLDDDDVEDDTDDEDEDELEGVRHEGEGEGEPGDGDGEDEGEDEDDGVFDKEVSSTVKLPTAEELGYNDLVCATLNAWPEAERRVWIFQHLHTSDYERDRTNNLFRNHAMLTSLGIHNAPAPRLARPRLKSSSIANTAAQTTSQPPATSVTTMTFVRPALKSDTWIFRAV